ncbi:ATP-binding protein, partial [Dactylosporangium sp. NPDC005572]|uniref:sensor histidine kinase n=1 Tax=Dactylosporangium sp. NPDC005572 TaxID=3156889 RepID=UPI0033A47264
ALANAAKHAHATIVHVDTAVSDGRLHMTVRDNGIGGADPGCGSGLTGLTDRVEALGGTIALDSPVGHGTCLQVELPLAVH